MGLKKPIKTGPVLPSLDELSAVDATPVEAGGYVVLDTVPGQDCTMESNTPISIKAELGKFGDATAADVASGKTFTSAAGLFKTGTGSIADTSGGLTVTITNYQYTVIGRLNGAWQVPSSVYNGEKTFNFDKGSPLFFNLYGSTSSKSYEVFCVIVPAQDETNLSITVSGITPKVTGNTIIKVTLGTNNDTPGPPITF